jgi:hypothetical protein
MYLNKVEVLREDVEDVGTTVPNICPNANCNVLVARQRKIIMFYMLM